MTAPQIRAPRIAALWASVPIVVPRIALLALSLLGWGLFLRMTFIAIPVTVEHVDGPVAGLGIDTYAYWLAGSRLLDGETIYRAATLSDMGSYRYPPPFAQAWIPVAMLPEVVADWGWRILGLLSIRYMAGSWFMSGIWMLFPGTIVELAAGNVTFQVAALTVAGLRGRAEGILPAMLVKFSSAAVIPFLWIRRPKARRGLLVGGVIAGTVLVASVIADAGAWRDYTASLSRMGEFPIGEAAILHILPTPAADYPLRLAIVAALVIASIRFDSPHIAFVAALFATPTLWEQRLAVLFALLTLESDGWLRPYRWPWSRDGAPAASAQVIDPAAAPARPGTFASP